MPHCDARRPGPVGRLGKEQAATCVSGRINVGTPAQRRGGGVGGVGGRVPEGMPMGGWAPLTPNPQEAEQEEDKLDKGPITSWSWFCS